ncbi:MBL fold metallo-hydrolase [Streptomyces iconiensis]|uniref:MBL fold metallo-hydrolase n=1 Tax=Streptomyces iconiensis TaxID=1384038 RepID=A0ABT7A163_9ACTN|nr:MBL fold metallo-hydrolase [Streptomyces iconiensis]MDJ1135075.1 MBL fold metallo-hydrolase [Streptomyces iconiensis]
METTEIGDIEVTRIVEWQGPVAPVGVVFPDLAHEKWHEHRSWVAPRFWDTETDNYLAATQTWVVRSEGRTILVDTGLGNHKERSYMPAWTHLETDFLDRLAAAGVRPEDVDVVVNTHVHADHVGWNTTLRDREWVPTFPNATYLIHRDDFEYWNPRNGVPKRGGIGGVNAGVANGPMFEDSIDPVHRAGQTLLWETSHRIDGNLHLEPAPGHTPGSAVLHLRSGTERALFVGDLLHTPLQILEPHVDTCLSEDQHAAAHSRRRVLEYAADTNALLIPAHFTGPGAAEVRRDGSSFALKKWAPFSDPSALIT